MTSIEKFFQNAIDVGAAAELITYKKLDTQQKQWITHVILFDSKEQRAVSMIIYSEAQYRSWTSDPASLGEAISQAIEKIEKSLAEIVEYRLPAAVAFYARWERETLRRAYTEYRFGLYYQAVRSASQVAERAMDYRIKADAWELAGLAGCAARRGDLAAPAVQRLISFNPTARDKVLRACKDHGMEWQGASFSQARW